MPNSVRRSGDRSDERQAERTGDDRRRRRLVGLGLRRVLVDGGDLLGILEAAERHRHGLLRALAEDEDGHLLADRLVGDQCAAARAWR